MRFFIWGNIKTMNILIIGNGFDLSHYLPTKYEHFMLVMQAIEKKDITKPVSNAYYYPSNNLLNGMIKAYMVYKVFDNQSYQMNFDALFSKFTKSQDKIFIVNTKQHYDTSKIFLEFNQIFDIQSKLKKNSWYEYFKNHIKEIDTWIDFETKIEDLLVVLAQCITKINLAEVDHNELSGLAEVVSSKEIKVLSFFDLFNEYGGRVKINDKYVMTPTSLSINAKFCYGKSSENEFNPNEFLRIIQKQLDEFIQIFNLYLELIVDKLEPNTQFKIESKDWVQPDHIFSFNYTNTFRKLYESKVKAEFLHGRFGEEQNIVLGVSDLEDESLRKLKAYGFTKYHQKLFKDTDYLFLDDCSQVKKRILGSKPSAMGKGTKFIIWGHSLDQSDQEYIKEIFKLNDERDIGVRVIVYYFDDNAKFILLNNLLDILKKDKVEKWMKNKWLIFEKNPEVKLVETIPKQTV